MRSGARLILLLLAAGCGPAESPPVVPDVEPVFPADFEQAFTESRDCRFSHEHDLINIRVFANAAAVEPYRTLSQPYPVGAMLVKPAYDDDNCATLIGYTAMKKLSVGENPDGGDWQWQVVSPAREVLEDGAPIRCLDCHRAHCGEPGTGYDLTCAQD